MQKKFVVYVEEMVAGLIDAGLIIQVVDYKIFVDRYVWIRMDNKAKYDFVFQFGRAYRIKNKTKGPWCYVYDYHSNKKLAECNEILMGPLLYE